MSPQPITPVFTSPNIRKMNYVFINETKYSTFLIGQFGKIPQVLDTDGNQVRYDTVASLAGRQIDIYLNNKLRELTTWNSDGTINVHGILRLSDDQQTMLLEAFIFQLQYLFSNVRLEETQNEVDYSFEGISYKIPIVNYTDPADMLCGMTQFLLRTSGVKDRSNAYTKTPQELTREDGSIVRVVDGFFSDKNTDGTPQFQLSKVSYQAVIDNADKLLTLEDAIGAVDISVSGKVDSTLFQTKMSELDQQDIDLETRIDSTINTQATNHQAQVIKNTQQDTLLASIQAQINDVKTYNESDETSDTHTIIVKVNERLDTKAEWEQGLQRVVLKSTKTFSQTNTIEFKVYLDGDNVAVATPQFVAPVQVYNSQTQAVKTSGRLTKGKSYLMHWDSDANHMRLTLEIQDTTAMLETLKAEVHLNRSDITTLSDSLQTVAHKTLTQQEEIEANTAKITTVETTTTNIETQATNNANSITTVETQATNNANSLAVLTTQVNNQDYLKVFSDVALNDWATNGASTLAIEYGYDYSDETGKVYHPLVDVLIEISQKLIATNKEQWALGLSDDTLKDLTSANLSADSNITSTITTENRQDYRFVFKMVGLNNMEIELQYSSTQYVPNTTNGEIDFTSIKKWEYNTLTQKVLEVKELSTIPTSNQGSVTKPFFLKKLSWGKIEYGAGNYYSAEQIFDKNQLEKVYQKIKEIKIAYPGIRFLLQVEDIITPDYFTAPGYSIIKSFAVWINESNGKIYISKPTIKQTSLPLSDWIFYAPLSIMLFDFLMLRDSVATLETGIAHYDNLKPYQVKQTRLGGPRYNNSPYIKYMYGTTVKIIDEDFNEYPIV